MVKTQQIDKGKKKAARLRESLNSDTGGSKDYRG